MALKYQSPRKCFTNTRNVRAEKRLFVLVYHLFHLSITLT